MSVLNGVGELAVVGRRDVSRGRTCQSRVKASSKASGSSFTRASGKDSIITLQHLRAAELAETQ